MYVYYVVQKFLSQNIVSCVYCIYWRVENWKYHIFNGHLDYLIFGEIWVIFPLPQKIINYATVCLLVDGQRL